MILVNGDSITYGQGLSNLKDAWPNLIFDNFNNIAEPGSSNVSIYRRTVEELFRRKYTKVVIGWSSLYRLEMADNYSKPKTVHPLLVRNQLEQVISKEWLGEFWYFKNFLFTLYQLKLITANLGINLQCFHFGTDIAEVYKKTRHYKQFKEMFFLELYSDKEIRHEFIIIKRMINNTKNLWIFEPEFDAKQIYMKNRAIISNTDYHPNILGHKLISQEVGNKIK